MLFRLLHLYLCSALLMIWIIGGLTPVAVEGAKSKAKGKAPDLRILSVEPAPVPFVPKDIPLTLTIMIELPKEIAEDTVLDVTTFITSASRNSFRLLNSRQAVPTTSRLNDDLDADPSRRIEIVHKWDGTDHSDRVVSDGVYAYQVQAKLMVMGKSGAPLTKMSAWKKKGTFAVKARSSAQSD